MHKAEGLRQSFPRTRDVGRHPDGGFHVRLLAECVLVLAVQQLQVVGDAADRAERALRAADHLGQQRLRGRRRRILGALRARPSERSPLQSIAEH